MTHTPNIKHEPYSRPVSLWTDTAAWFRLYPFTSVHAAYSDSCKECTHVRNLGCLDTATLRDIHLELAGGSPLWIVTIAIRINAHADNDEHHVDDTACA